MMMIDLEPATSKDSWQIADDLTLQDLAFTPPSTPLPVGSPISFRPSARPATHRPGSPFDSEVGTRPAT